MVVFLSLFCLLLLSFGTTTAMSWFCMVLFSPRLCLLGCATSDILQHIHRSCAEWGRYLGVGGIGNRFASEGDPSKWCCSSGVQTFPSEDKLDCFTSISLISSPRSLWASSVLCSFVELVISKAHNRRTAWVKIYHGCLVLLYALPCNTSVLV